MAIEELKRPERIDEDRIEKLKELFPEAFADGELNIELLNEEVTALNQDSISDSKDEFFTMNWSGKKEGKRQILPTF